MQFVLGSTGFCVASHRGVGEGCGRRVFDPLLRRFWMDFVHPDFFASAYTALHGGLVS